jgi:DNA-binding CsgD family transcriptional regulator
MASLIGALAQLAGSRAVQLQAERRDRAAAYAAVHDQLTTLRSSMSTEALLEAAVGAALACCDVDHVAVGRVRSDTWIVDAFAPEPGNGLLRGTELRLGDAERGVMRTRRAAVLDRSIVAPVISRSRVVAVLRADCTRPPDVDGRERDLLEAFAEGLGRQLERLELEETFRAHDQRMRDALTADTRWDRWRLDEPPAPSSPRAAGRTTRVALLLSPREREVMDLVADGRRNAQIAEELVVSEATVKSHLTAIMRKLHVGNRAEAVARYMSLTAEPTG